MTSKAEAVVDLLLDLAASNIEHARDCWAQDDVAGARYHYGKADALNMAVGAIEQKFGI